MRKTEKYSNSNLAVHSDTRSSKYCQQTEIASALCFEKSVCHTGMKMFKNLSYSLKNLVIKEASMIKRFPKGTSLDEGVIMWGTVKRKGLGEAVMICRKLLSNVRLV